MIRVIAGGVAYEFEGLRGTASNSGIEPDAFLMAFALRGELWEIDLSNATSEECAVWAPVDMGARIFRALSRETPVIVLGQTFRGLSELPQLQAVLEGIQGFSCVESDTPEELRIGITDN